MTVGMSPERLSEIRFKVERGFGALQDQDELEELLDEVDRQAEEIKALRLHVRVSGEHYKALGVEVGPEHMETDATARGLECERPRASGFGSMFVTHRKAGRSAYPFDMPFREDSVCRYANTIAAEHDAVDALGVLEDLAEQAKADR